MKAAATFEASTRLGKGKSEARKLRVAGKIPAMVYARGESNTPITLDENKITREYRMGGFFSKVVEIKMDGKSMFALPKDISFHPVSERIEHIDFMHVNDNSTIKVLVPVRFLNQERSIGLKRGGALNIVRHELELVCKVTNIPRAIEIDLLDVQIGDSIHISQIALPEGVTPAITSRDFTVATITGRGGKDEDAAGETPAAGDVPAAKAAAPAAKAAPAANKK